MPTQTQRQIEARQENEALRALACLYSVLSRSGLNRGDYMFQLDIATSGIRDAIEERRELRRLERERG